MVSKCRMDFVHPQGYCGKWGGAELERHGVDLELKGFERISGRPSKTKMQKGVSDLFGQSGERQKQKRACHK